ncbi:MAG: HlyC/CorC family transporter [Hyphomicrobiaceae bacterium]|nr:HlyC/CorC family transporter [Hyphomicrobiaceae bacterium]
MTESDPSGAVTGESQSRSGGSESSGESEKQSLFARVRAMLGRNDKGLRSDLQAALDSAEADNAQFSDGERTMLANVLKLAETTIEDVMVPRADIEAIDADDTLGDALGMLREAGHSRLPVYEESLDDILGLVHIKDLVTRLTEPVKVEGGVSVKLRSALLKQKLKTQDFLREVLFVPPSMPVSDLLQLMQATRNHMAIVVDEYGGTDGLVTIEDLVEVVVGDIEDEHDDEDAALIWQESEHVYSADARASLEEVREMVGPDFDPGELEEEADTLGGLMFSLIDRVPVRGELITKFKGFDFEVLQADPRRVKRVRIIRRALPPVRVRPKQRPESGAAQPAEPSSEPQTPSTGDAGT